MLFTRRHPPDATLLLAADQALPRYRQAMINHHLRRCAGCRARLLELERIFIEAVETCRDLPPAVPTSTDAVRARLHDQMATLSATWGQSWWVRLHRQVNHLPAFARVGASLLLVVVVVQGMRLTSRHWPSPASASFAGVLPIRALTPGAVVEMDAQTLCAARGTARQPIERSVREAVLRDYRMAQVAEREYELDYLITPELGGTAEAKNLWPERYDSGIWNARVKDDLERLLPQLVCEGRLDLRTAQRDMAGDWIAAYQNYFQTEYPIPPRAGLRDDDDDGPRVAYTPVIVEAFETRLPPSLLRISGTAQR